MSSSQPTGRSDAGDRQRGEELSQLARLLFDAAAQKWYLAGGLEIVAGLLGLALGLFDIPDDWALLGAIVGLCILFVAYGLRLWSEDQHETAETMRRQAVLTEGIGWPIDRHQSSKWRDKAGKRIREKFRFTPRAADYYTTEQDLSPLKMAEMTMESAFYTRLLYTRLRVLVWVAFAGAVVMSVLALFAAGFEFTSATTDSRLVLAVSLLLPLVLSLDLLGWALRLYRQVGSICAIEEEFERLTKDGTISVTDVLRLMAEYNCEVANGIPVLSWLFWRWHDDIRDQWERHIA